MVWRESYRFLIVGTLTVVIDFSTYQGLRFFELLDIDTAKLLGFILGTIFSYIVNKLWTFRKRGKDDFSKSLPLFLLLYAFTMWINVSLNSLVLNALIGVAYSIGIAFLCATFVSALVNFIGMKFLVFR
jgi:putative flippase GtrA